MRILGARANSYGRPGTRPEVVHAMSWTAPTINAAKAREPNAPAFEAEKLPPWLVSLIVHLALIMVLGLWYVRETRELPLDLVLLPPLEASPADVAIDVAGSDFSPNVLEESAPTVIAEELQSEAIPLEVDLTNLLPAASLASPLADELAASVGGGEGMGLGGADAGLGPGRSVTSMFGLAGEGGRFVYVFDRSESMNSVLTMSINGAKSFDVTPLRAAKAELIRSLQGLNDGSEFQIVFYSDEPEMFGGRQRVFPADLANKQSAEYFVAEMQADGNTNHLSALYEAVGCRPDVIFLLTDGESKDDLDRDAVRKLTRICKRQRTKIFVVHFCFEVRQHCSLIAMAEATGGVHRFVTLRELGRQELERANDLQPTTPIN